MDNGKLKHKKFYSERVCKNNPKWELCIQREERIYPRKGNLRSEFYRDYTRLLHSMAYRRLKHKTQVFFATGNDHVCTRMEHVNHVTSVSYIIAQKLGLNVELTGAIAIGHDLGHAPFGHQGETILEKISQQNLGEKFWHEKNSLNFVSNIETLPDPYGYKRNLNLTYGVKDGIISHCGEVDEKAVFPRDDLVDLDSISEPSQHAPFTWEGCVVKISDKVAYLGRDIEDAITLGILKISDLRCLKNIIRRELNIDAPMREINNTVLMNDFIVDLCKHSCPEKGIVFSSKYFKLISAVKKFNYEKIYYHDRINCFKRYAELIIESIFETLIGCFDYEFTLDRLAKHKKYCPSLNDTFPNWLIKYTDIDHIEKEKFKCRNKTIYKIASKKEYIKSVLDYISGMTDSYALRIFNELISFK